MKKQAVLITGAIGSGKTLLAKILFSMDEYKEYKYISSDHYKKRDFNTISKIGYVLADDEAYNDMVFLCQQGKCFVYERCPTNRSKLEAFWNLTEKYNYKRTVYFLGTDDLKINVSRVQQRQKDTPSHTVNRDKIKVRYKDSYKRIYELLIKSDICYFVDNSSEKMRIIGLYHDEKITLYEEVSWIKKFVIKKLSDRIINK